jgi:hypothetical protein
VRRFPAVPECNLKLPHAKRSRQLVGPTATLCTHTVAFFNLAVAPASSLLHS